MKRMFFVAVVLLSLGIKNALVASDNEFFNAQPCALSASPAHESLAVLARADMMARQRSVSLILPYRKSYSQKQLCRKGSLQDLKKELGKDQ